MALRQRWRGLLMLPVALLLVSLFSACASPSSTHSITGAAATTGPVTVTTNLSTYTSGEPVGATVTNSSKSEYYTQNGKSGCTIVQLEQFNTQKGLWSPVDICNGSQATQTLTIGESTSVPYTLAPSSSSDPNAWQPGTYRVSVSYSTQGDGITSPQEAHSAAFTITP